MELINNELKINEKISKIPTEWNFFKDNFVKALKIYIDKSDWLKNKTITIYTHYYEIDIFKMQ